MSRILASVLLSMLVLTAAMGLKTIVTAHSNTSVVMANGGDPFPEPPVMANGGDPFPQPPL